MPLDWIVVENLNYIKISASNDLDEHEIKALKINGAMIDIWGVGTKLITSYDNPALGFVYKLVSKEGVPVIKLSENIEKITYPGKKDIYRIFSESGDIFLFDVVCLNNENINDIKKYQEIKFSYACKYKFLLVPIIDHGVLINTLPQTKEIKTYCNNVINKLFNNKIISKYVIYSENLIKQRNELIKKYKRV